MKKRGMILGLVIVSIMLTGIISSASLVSASWFDDFWNKLTGKVAENLTEDGTTGSEEEVEPEPPAEEVEPEPPPEEEVEPEPPEEEECIEEGEKGGLGAKCCEGLKEVSDCLPNQPCPISLRYCVNCGNDKCEDHENKYNCAKDCEEEEPPEKQCDEGDEQYYTCEDGTKVPECMCEDEKWVCIISPKENCPDTEPEKCAAEIKITFNKDTYKIGDPLKVIIETFDSEGNHLPNYAFYAQMYDDRWHTPDLKETDNKGYFIHTGTVEKPVGGVTKVKFKVYTKETSSCGSVEDIEEVKFELEECGFGECAPEPECKNKVKMCGGVCPPCPEDKEKEIFYPCSGCELNKKCYPYGFRKGGNYCSDENDAFVKQLGDYEECENNFECKTNICINGNCVSATVWNRFLEWFNTISGGGKKERGPEMCSKLLLERDIKDWEYLESLYGNIKESQVPVYAEDGTYLDTIKCCMAGYRREETDEEKAALVCQYDDRQELENSFYWILVKKQGITLDLGLIEYKDEKVYGSADIAIVWTSDNYLVASGGDPRVGTPLSEDITDAYLRKYKNDLEDIDISYIPRIPEIEPRQLVFCTEEDKELAKACHHDRGGAPQSDPSTFDGTKESKERCIESKGYGEGCCEVYTGCIMPDEDCEEIEIVGKESCYWHVARLTQNADLCEEITDIGYKDKCLRDVIKTTQDPDTCEKITDSAEKADCYIKLAIKNSEDSICKKITDSNNKDKCYANVAEQTKNVDTCAKIEDESLQDKCYFWIAE